MQLTNSVPEEGLLLFQNRYNHHHIILNHLLLDFNHLLVLQIIINNKTLSSGDRISPCHQVKTTGKTYSVGTNM